jgi:hypothetical protein
VLSGITALAVKSGASWVTRVLMHMVTISFLVRWAEILSVSHLPLPPDNVNKIKTVLLIKNLYT